MRVFLTAIAVVLAITAFSPATAQTVVGVSWSNFQEERWKTDEAAIKAQLEKLGAKYISADAMDKDAILPAVNKAIRQKIPVVAYDRLIEVPGIFYITFDNVEVGRMQAREVFKLVPKGNYVFIKGSPTDPNANFLRAGAQEIVDGAVKKGDIKIVGDEYTDGWKPDVAQKNMEQILTKNANKVDAVVAANDGTAGGVVAALTAKGLRGIPVSGQDADHAALNRIALGTQTVSVWKDSREARKLRVLPWHSPRASRTTRRPSGAAARRRSSFSRGFSRRCRSPAATSTSSSRPAGSARPKCARA